MRKTLFALLLLTFARPAFAGDLRLEFQNGFVTLSAHDVPVRQILQEWARKGQTRIVNAERVMGGPVSIQLTHIPEDKALDIVLRSVAGYMAAPRAVPVANASSYDRILVMATSSAAPAVARTGGPGGYSQPPVFQPPTQQGPNFPPGGNPAAAMPEGQGEGGTPPGFVPDTDDSDQPVSPPLVQQDGEVPPGGANQNGVPAPGTVPQGAPGLQQQTGAPEQMPDQQQQQQPPPPPGPTPLQPGVITTTGPGQVPVPENQQQQGQPQPEQ